MDVPTWKKRKRTGAIKKKLSKKLKAYSINQTNEPGIYEQDISGINGQPTGQVLILSRNERGSAQLQILNNEQNEDVGLLTQEKASDNIESVNISESNEIVDPSQTNCETESDSTDEEEEATDFLKNNLFRDDIKKWAIDKNISQEALKELTAILNKRFPDILPKDPRSILQTCRKVVMKSINGGGEYWHNGLTSSLSALLEKWEHCPETIHLNINFDGLPIYKSSKLEFWPILCNVFENQNIQPIIIGIYNGIGKPKNLSDYLEDFVTEMRKLLSDGIHLNRSNNTITIAIRCFICDSPARAFIKGVCSFNKHGCLKCTTVGDYSHISHTVVFPETNSAERTDDGFRKKLYGQHHKADSPLLQLPINMVNDFPVADSLHLIDLGVMKRLLMGWREGNFGRYVTKWCSRDISAVQDFLIKCKLPSEIHRSVRGIDYLAYWKASEFRSFLFYLSIVILPHVLPRDAFTHFLFLYCAITICSSKNYNNMLPLSKDLLQYFVEHYKDFYGPDHITSNIHNLLHVTDEVELFGPLHTFSAYPFENKLYQIKKILRGGKKPLSQVAKRLSEAAGYLIYNDIKGNQREWPRVTKNSKKVTKIQFPDFVLSTKQQDKYFITKNNEIVELKSIDKENIIHAYVIQNTTDVFDYPVKSSYFNIFKAKLSGNQRIHRALQLQDVKCKLVCILNKELYFVPLLHTV